MTHPPRTTGFALGMALALAGASALAAPPADWSKVPSRKITALHPGQSSMEWILTKKDHSSANQLLQKNRACNYCHEEEAADIGKLVASGKKLEPSPVAGKPGSIPVSVQAAHDGTNLYLRLEWKPVAAGGGKKMDPDNQVKLAVMIDDNKVEFGNLGGCWATCHNDLRTMPDAPDGAAKHPKAKALGWNDGVTKYIKESRTGLEMTKKPRGAWDKLKPDADIQAALAAGKFMDLIQFRSGAKPVDGHVLETRHMEGGKSLVSAEGKLDGDTRTVVFTRKLAAGGPGDHAIAAGRQYNLGFAIHEDHSAARFHYTSFNYTLALDDPKADINAVKQ